MIRRRDLYAGEDDIVGEPVIRAWGGGFPAVSPSRGLLAVGRDTSRTCDDFTYGVDIVDLERSATWPVEWTVGGENDTPVGTLPDGSGLLVQHSIGDVSRIYAVSFSGETSVAVEQVDAAMDSAIARGLVPGRWYACGTARRIGPACELLCADENDVLTRVPLRGGAPEPVACAELVASRRVMDILQLPRSE